MTDNRLTDLELLSRENDVFSTSFQDIIDKFAMTKSRNAFVTQETNRLAYINPTQWVMAPERRLRRIMVFWLSTCL